MKSIGTKLVLSALGITAMLMSPVLAKKPHQATQGTEMYSTISGYDKDGGVVAIPNPDRESQR